MSRMAGGSVLPVLRPGVLGVRAGRFFDSADEGRMASVARADLAAAAAAVLTGEGRGKEAHELSGAVVWTCG